MPIGAAGVAAIGAGATLAASGGNAYLTGKTNRKTRQFSEKMYQAQVRDNIHFWNMQNDYNHPLQQMARLKEAGLNPHLIYGNGAVANNSQTPQGGSVLGAEQNAPQIDASAIGEGIGTYWDMKMKPVAFDAAKQNLDNLKKQGAFIDAQTIQALASSQGTDASTQMKKFDLGYKMQMKDTQASILESILKKYKADTDFTVDQNTRNQAMHNSMMTKMSDDLKTTALGRTKTQAEINEIAEKIVQMRKDGKIKDFEIYLNQLGLTKSDGTLIRKGFNDLQGYDYKASTMNQRRLDERFYKTRGNQDHKWWKK